MCRYRKTFQKYFLQSDMATHTCNPSTGRQRQAQISEFMPNLVTNKILGQPRLHSKISQKKGKTWEVLAAGGSVGKSVCCISMEPRFKSLAAQWEMMSRGNKAERRGRHPTLASTHMHKRHVHLCTDTHTKTFITYLLLLRKAIKTCSRLERWLSH